ncbi:hypothetical protein QJS10_CPB17g00033 [Acorus calamus]|uniref:Uncharacterized protein n=1 Tax=Acorus calamus TaxID=4465 RepID=A0AAV9CUG5_ACOCL|nr:hypothetical protein QJS10_CPB17g00033 [Acorus calamus]
MSRRPPQILSCFDVLHDHPAKGKDRSDLPLLWLVGIEDPFLPRFQEGLLFGTDPTERLSDVLPISASANNAPAQFFSLEFPLEEVLGKGVFWVFHRKKG